MTSELRYIVDFDKAILELRKADKYYISFRILNRWGFYFQGLNCLLFSLETFFKLLYILDREDYTNSELKKIGHNLREAFNTVNLEQERFDLIFKIISHHDYTEIRYNSPDLLNELNTIDDNREYIYLKKLHSEIEELHRIITMKIRARLNVPLYRAGLNIEKYHLLDTPEKKNLIDDSLSRGDPNFSLDRC